MTRLLHLILLLVASSLVITATVHARELPEATALECSGAVHSEGDADQSQGDADKAIPHHHGTCQGSAMHAPFGNNLSPSQHVGDMQLSPGSDQFLASGKVAPGLRPPNA